MAGHSSDSLAEILDIDGNRAVYERLKELLSAGSAMGFVGAGASFPLYPLWGQLIGEFAGEPQRRGLADEAARDHWLRNAERRPLHVAKQIRDKLTEKFTFTFLYETFKDRSGSDGEFFTPTHAALVRANFKALLTTNYDSGLVEACRVLRPEIRDTRFAVWNQNFEVNRWINGDVFDGAPCPILYAHGHFADPPSIVLDAGSYRRAYHSTPYRRLFENLWLQEHLVFVGFSFNDLVLTQIAEEVLWETARQGGGAPRHIAVLGLPEKEEYTPEMRHEFLEPFDAEVLFYPVCRTAEGHPDHAALQVLLDSLAPESPSPTATELPTTSRRPTAPEPSADPTPAPAEPILEFVHESTEDARFTGRLQVLGRLDDWAADLDVRVIGITAIGGLGKTALLGRWLRSESPAVTRGAEGVFFWSYYRDGETNAMLKALLAFGRERLNWAPSAAVTDKTQVDQALELLQQRRIVLALDGLEVVQETPDTVAYGKLLAPELADLLHRSSRAVREGLVVLTSRFPFPDLTQHLGGPLRLLPLPALAPSEGADLLSALEVGGEPENREEVSRQLSGHPLALRVFARSMPADLGGDPTRLWQRIFDAPHPTDGDSLEGKMRRLLAFYEQCLPEAHSLVLGLLALFRTPVGEETLGELWEQGKTKTKRSGGVLDRLKQRFRTGRSESLHGILDHLHREHLLTADSTEDGPPRYACHPILRDYFRGRLLGQATLIRNAANLLAEQPDAQEPRSLEGVQLIVAAIEILLEAGELEAADELYRTRLDNGRMFLYLPAPHWGMEVARWFVRDETRRSAVHQQLGERRLSFYLNEVALFANYAGEPETALEFYPQSAEIDRKAEDWNNLSIGLQNLGATEIALGLVIPAQEHLEESLQLARKAEVDKEICRRLASVGLIASLHGDRARADTNFAEANAIQNRIHHEGVDLYSIRGIHWAEHLLRSGDLARARRLTDANIKICQENNWQGDIGSCEWIFGWLDTAEGRWGAALGHLSAARAIFLRGHMIFESAGALVTEAAALLGKGDISAASTACERGRHLAAPRNYRLVHADALLQRARIWLHPMALEPGPARDDAEAALHLADSCSYAWGQRDAYLLLSTACGHLGDPEAAAHHRTQAEHWESRLGDG